MSTPFDPASGQKLLIELQDDTTTRAWRATVSESVPGFDEWIVGAVFGGTYQRPGLSLRDRQLLTIGALTALGGVEPQLSGQFVSSVKIGMTRAEIAESLVHLVPYVGLPRVMAALRLLPATADTENESAASSSQPGAA